MALTLIIYPATGYNSFVTLAEADTYAESLIGFTEWTALTDDDKMRLLITAFRNIVSLNGITLPATSEECLKESQVILAVNDNNLSISTSGGQASGQIKSAKVGSVAVEYVDGNPASQYSYWDDQYMRSCLASYGALIPTSGFSQIPLTRS